MQEHISEKKAAHIEKIDDPHKAFAALVDLIGRLKERYPDKTYPEERLLRDIYGPRPGKKSSLLSYTAHAGEKISGVLAGERHDHGLFFGRLVLVDPALRGAGTLKDLFDAVKRDFSEIQLLAASSGESKDASDEKYIDRQNALFRVYERFGFTPVVSNEQYQQAHQTGAAIRMVWRKEDKQTKTV